MAEPMGFQIERISDREVLAKITPRMATSYLENHRWSPAGTVARQQKWVREEKHAEVLLPPPRCPTRERAERMGALLEALALVENRSPLSILVEMRGLRKKRDD